MNPEGLHLTHGLVRSTGDPSLSDLSDWSQTRRGLTVGWATDITGEDVPVLGEALGNPVSPIRLHSVQSKSPYLTGISPLAGMCISTLPDCYVARA